MQSGLKPWTINGAEWTYIYYCDILLVVFIFDGRRPNSNIGQKVSHNITGRKIIIKLYVFDNRLYGEKKRILQARNCTNELIVVFKKTASFNTRSVGPCFCNCFQNFWEHYSHRASERALGGVSALCAGGLRRHRTRLSWKPVSSFWLHGEEGGAPSIITTGHHCSIVRAAADAEIIAEGAIFSEKGACHGHVFAQIRTSCMMCIDYEVRQWKVLVKCRCF